jgi:hypothetical protein
MHTTVNAPIIMTAAHSIQDTRVPLMPDCTRTYTRKSRRFDEVPYNVAMKYSVERRLWNMFLISGVAFVVAECAWFLFVLVRFLASSP